MLSFILFLIILITPTHVSAWFGSTNVKPATPYVEKLTEYLKAGKSRLNEGVSIVSIPGAGPNQHERGVELSGHHQPGEELAWISSQEFITPSQGLSTDVGCMLSLYLSQHPHLEKAHSPALPALHIAIFLCLVRANIISGGTYQDYVDTLPSISSLGHLPIFWPELTARELQNSRVRNSIGTRLSEWHDEYDLIMDAIASSSVDTNKNENGEREVKFVDFEMWSWARSIICSRSFTNTHDTESDVRGMCLIPFIDMLNHNGETSGNCVWDIDQLGLTLSLPPTVEGGDNNKEFAIEKEGIKASSSPIEISYGSHSNGGLLMNYGFSVLNDALQTPLDKGMVSISLCREENANQKIKALWEKDGLGDCYKLDRNVTLSIGDRSSTESLLSLCRVSACLDDEELFNMTMAFERRGETTSQQTADGLVPQLAATLSRRPFSESNEIRAMEILWGVTLENLSMYATTLSEDEQLLMSKRGRGEWWRKSWNILLGGMRRRRKEEDSNIRNAIITRRSEKRVIQHFHNLAGTCLGFLLRSDEIIDFDEYQYLLAAQIGNEEPLLVNGAFS